MGSSIRSASWWKKFQDFFNSMEHTYTYTYIYALHDPRTWEIVYVGKSNDPEKRLKDHKLRLRDHTLKISILQVCRTEEWQRWEKFWIALVRNAGGARLNASDGGDGILIPKPFSPTHRAKLSASRIGIKFSAETIEKMRIAGRFRKASLETRQKMSAARKGKHFGSMSQSGRANIRAVRIGTKASEETKKKMSIARLGYKPKQESIEKTAVAHRGRKATPEARLHMSIAHLGQKHIPHSEKTKEKIKEAAKVQWTRIREKMEAAQKVRWEKYYAQKT